MRFVRNLILSAPLKFHYNDVTLASFISVKYDIAIEGIT